MDIINELLDLENEKLSFHLMSFFKTKKGEYGEGDKFLGIRTPVVREISKKYYKTITFEKLEEMLKNKYHEIRLCALLAMVFIYEKTDKKKEIFEFYLKHTKSINNWDLVDLTAPKIVGAYYLQTKDPTFILKLSSSNDLWENRISIVSQLSVIKSGDFVLALELCQKFLSHKHDLMHKAVGWMLREVGKKDEKTLLLFLDKNYKIMPRTALRYSLERLSEKQRKFYMAK